MPHLRQFAKGAHDVGLGVELSRLGVEFAADDVLIDAGVADDVDFVDSGGLPLVHAHLVVDGVAVDTYLDGVHVEEEVALVGVEFGDGVIVLDEAFVEFLEVVGVAAFDAEDGVEVFVGIDGVADPCDVAEEVLLALIDSEIDVHAGGVFGRADYAVGDDLRIAVADFVVLVDDQLLVVLKLLRDEFLGAEEVDDVVVVGLLHGVVDLVVSERLVARDVDVSDLGFRLFIHVDSHFDVARVVFVVELEHLDLGVVEAFFGKVLGDDLLRTVGEVGRHLSAFLYADFDFDVLFLALFQAVVCHVGDTGALFEGYLEPDFVALNLGGFDFDIGEEPLFPEAFERLGDLVARHLNLVAHRQAREADEHEILVTVGTRDADTCDFVGLALHGVLDGRCGGCRGVGSGVGLRGKRHGAEQGEQYKVNVSVHWSFQICVRGAGSPRWRGKTLRR